MTVTNIYGLPSRLEEIVKQDRRPRPENRYSVTELLRPIKYIILSRRYYDRLTIDVADQINMLFGSAFHSLMESGADNEEIKLEHRLPSGITISGVIDKFEDFTITEWKTTTAYKWKLGDFEDWKKQGILYAWLLRKNGKIANKLRVVGFIKDWKRSQADCDALYPPTQIMEWEYNITTEDILWAEQFINEVTTALIKYKDEPDNVLPQFSDDELWKKPDKWALFNGKNKRATRVYDHPVEAGENQRVEFRRGEYTRIIHDKTLEQLLRITGEIKNYI